MAVVLAGIGTFLATDGAVLLVQFVRLLLADFAFLAFLMDALVLIGQTVVHLGAARVLLLPFGFGRCAGGQGGKGDGGQADPA
jgi:hypothetical protein